MNKKAVRTAASSDVIDQLDLTMSIANSNDNYKSDLTLSGSKIQIKLFQGEGTGGRSNS